MVERGSLPEEVGKEFFLYMSDAAFVVGPDETLVGLNPAAERLLGFSEGQQVSLLDVAAAIAVPINQLAEAIAAPEESIVRTATHSFGIASFVVAGQRAVIVRDVSIEQDSMARQAMLDMLRHDMMTPISTAKGVVDLLQNQGHKLSDEQRTKLLTALGRAVDNVERLARNLRSDARLEAPRLEEDFSDIDVIGLIEELKRDLQSAAEGRSVRLQVRAEPDSPTTFRGAYLLVRQALENLMMNAIRFSPPDGTVTVTSSADDESIRFDVSDEGPGIPIGDQRELFARFERRRRKDDPPATGLGLGLSIVKRVAEAHGGTVHLQSEPGRGSTFSICFPIVPKTVSVSV